MFLPNLMPSNSQHMWINETPQRKPAAAKSPQQARLVENEMRGAVFAPPLSSYSSAHVGATISTSSTNSNAVFSSEVESRLAYLASLKTLGYSYIRPLGIGKTMKNLIEEQQSMDTQEQGGLAYNSEFTESVVGGTTENNMVGQPVDAVAVAAGQTTQLVQNQSTQTQTQDLIFQDEGTRTQSFGQPQAEGTGFTDSNREIDLDAEIPVHEDDEYFNTVFDQDEDEEDEYEQDEGFMAEDDVYDDEEAPVVRISPPEHVSFSEAADYSAEQRSGYLESLGLGAGSRNVSTSTRISSLNADMIREENSESDMEID